MPCTVFGSHSRFTSDEASECRKLGTWQFRPLRFKQFQAPTRIHHKVHFAGAVAPEEEAASEPSAAFPITKLGKKGRLPDCAYRWRLPKRFLGPNIQQSAK